MTRHAKQLGTVVVVALALAAPATSQAAVSSLPQFEQAAAAQYLTGQVTLPRGAVSDANSGSNTGAGTTSSRSSSLTADDQSPSAAGGPSSSSGPGGSGTAPAGSGSAPSDTGSAPVRVRALAGNGTQTLPFTGGQAVFVAFLGLLLLALGTALAAVNRARQRQVQRVAH